MVNEAEIQAKLPSEIVQKLGQLDLELAEGDITQKGFDKKRAQLLAPFLPRLNAVGPKSQASPITKAQRRHQRRATRDENRYHSEIRIEAVQQALAQYNKLAPSRLPVPAPVKRPSNVGCKNNERFRHEKNGRRNKGKCISDSSSDEDSLINSSGDSSERNVKSKPNDLRPPSYASPLQPQSLQYALGDNLNPLTSLDVMPSSSAESIDLKNETKQSFNSYIRIVCCP